MGMHIHPSGAIAFTISLDCNYNALKKAKGGRLYQDMQKKLKQSIAFQAVAGSAGLSVEDVGLTAVGGKLGVLEATITPKDEAASSEILRQFSHPKQMKQALTKSLSEIQGLNNVCPLPNSVVGTISPPMVKVCPQSFCPPGNLKMRSHGMHSLCQASGKTLGGKLATKQYATAKKQYITLEACQTACLHDDNCYGAQYDFLSGGTYCELWMQPIHFCSVVPAPHSNDDVKSIFECYSKCERTNMPIVLSETVWVMEFVVAYAS